MGRSQYSRPRDKERRLRSYRFVPFCFLIFKTGPRLADKTVVPCLGDIDNDGDLDLWLGRAGRDLLLLSDGKGKFTQAPAQPEPGGRT